MVVEEGNFFALSADMFVAVPYTFTAWGVMAMRWNTADTPNVTKGYIGGGAPQINSNTSPNNYPCINMNIGQGGNIVRSPGFTGYMAECLTFATELSLTDANTLGGNQATYWGLSWATISV